MRMQLFTLLLLGLLGSPPAAPADNHEWLGSVDEAIALAREGDRLILVDLYADWCGWCKKLESEVFSTSIFKDFTKGFVLLRVDTEDGGEGTLLQEKFEAYNLPTTLVLDSDQVRVGEVMGFAPADRFVEAIQKELDAFDQLVQGYDRFGQTSDLRALAILADEFHARNDGGRAASLYRKMLATEEVPPEKAVLIQYQLTDALRLAGRYDEALRQVDDTRLSASLAGRTDLVERLDLLGAQVALDKGDCQKAETALKEFLKSHQKSQLRQQANRTLATLRADGYQCL